MRMATKAIHKIWFVNDHESNRTFQFYSAEAALKWKQELVEDFDTNPDNIVVFEREYDEFGNWHSQKYI